MTKDITYRLIWCCGCGSEVQARLTDGKEIYPRHPDLAWKPLWKCDACGNYVGCHDKTDTPTNPLGNIPTEELRNARSHIHKILDPIWKNGHRKRSEVYREIAEELGLDAYHTAEIRTIEEAREVWTTVKKIHNREIHGINPE
jgi:hypothetical protein